MRPWLAPSLAQLEPQPGPTTQTTEMNTDFHPSNLHRSNQSLQTQSLKKEYNTVQSLTHGGWCMLLHLTQKGAYLMEQVNIPVGQNGQRRESGASFFDMCRAVRMRVRVPVY